MSRYVIACGGTGGHMAPGIAVAEELAHRGHECVLLVSRKGVDEKLAAKYSELTFVKSPGRGFGLKPFTLAAFLLSQVQAFVFAFRLLGKRPVSAVMAFGGFMSLGAVLAAWLRRIPVVLHEANRNPGRAIKLLRHFARYLYLPDGIRLPGVPLSRIRYHGYPVRKEIRRQDRIEARSLLGFDPDGKLLLVFGGSQGAASLNKWAFENARALCSSGVSVYCIAGPAQNLPEDILLSDKDCCLASVRFVPFCERMDLALSAADLAVSRAGAGSIAEFTECTLPSILVPFPHAADNHQLANARHLEKQGGCILVEQHNIENLLSEVLDLAFSDWMLERMCANLRQARKVGCVGSIASDLISFGAPVSGELSQDSARGESGV